MIWVVLVSAAMAAWYVGLAIRPPSSQQIDGIAAACGIETTAASRQFIASYLATGRRLRTFLVIATMVLPPVVSYAVGAADHVGEVTVGWTAILAACLAGTLAAELWVTRPSSTERAASLVPRERSAYLSRPLRWSVPAAGAAAAITWGGVWLLTEPLPGHADLADPADRVTGLVLGIVVPVAVAVAQRWILRRPQPVVAPDLLVADDATRAASVRMLAGVGTAMALLDLAGAAMQYTRPDNGMLDFVAGGIAAVSLVLAVAVWSARKPDYLTIPRRPAELAA